MGQVRVVIKWDRDVIQRQSEVVYIFTRGCNSVYAKLLLVLITMALPYLIALFVKMTSLGLSTDVSYCSIWHSN